MRNVSKCLYSLYSWFSLVATVGTMNNAVLAVYAAVILWPDWAAEVVAE